MPFSFAVVCEAAADRETACALADRVFCAEVDWLTEEILDQCRQWRGATPGDLFLPWTKVDTLAKHVNLRAHGHFDGQPQAHHAHAARKALLLLKHLADSLDGVFLIRDDDRETERRHGLEQARGAVKLGIPIVIGLAHLERECWVLAGFEPITPKEAELVKDLRRQLGFDPRLRADRLTAKHDHEERSAKRILRILTDDDRDREAECYRRTDLKILAERGQAIGLADYLSEVSSLVVPTFG